MAQPVRTETLARFKDGAVHLLVCSDVAARGLDLPEVSHVFNFDVPVHAEDYIHRIGRTGRAGRAGRSITLALPEESRALHAVGRLLGHPIPEMAVDAAAAWSGDDMPAKRGRRRRGSRRNAETRAKTKAATRQDGPQTAAPDRPASDRFAPDRPAPDRPASEKSLDQPATKRAAKGRPAKPWPAEETGGTSKPFGEDTPAFLLRPVDLA